MIFSGCDMDWSAKECKCDVVCFGSTEIVLDLKVVDKMICLGVAVPFKVAMETCQLQLVGRLTVNGRTIL